MSLDKSIASGKEHRKPYRKAKAGDRTCRNHGSCTHCKDNRLYSAKKALIEIAEKAEIADFFSPLSVVERSPDADEADQTGGEKREN